MNNIRLALLLEEVIPVATAYMFSVPYTINYIMNNIKLLLLEEVIPVATACI